MKTRRMLLVSVMAALAAPLTAVPPASADPVFPVCADVVPVPDLLADPTYVSLCIGGETGVYDPLWGPYCYTGGCYFSITAGHTGVADVDAQLCTAAAAQQPLCVAIDSGTIPLYRVDPVTICYGWSPWMPPCYRDVDEQ